jgi:hypothetical protein
LPNKRNLVFKEVVLRKVGYAKALEAFADFLKETSSAIVLKLIQGITVADRENMAGFSPFA